MTTQRKLLTAKQKEEICTARDECIGCPLRLGAYRLNLCEEDVKDLEQAIKDFWNEEVEVDL